MKKHLLFILLLLLSASQFVGVASPLFSGKGGQGGEAASPFFIRILPDRETLYAGDSMLVSIVLYAEQPIAEAACSSEIKVKGNCSLRALHINRNATASRTRENGKIYYTLVWGQYVVAPREIGTFTIPALKFKATLQEVVRMPSFFDQMMGARPEYKETKVSATSDAYKFQAKERPLRSTEEIIRKGGRIL